MGEEIRISEFNELQFKMIRIHKLQDQINELWINPLSPNLSFGDYNYNLIVANLESLYAEVQAKCEDKEKKDVDEKFEALEKLIDESPPYEKNNHPSSRKAHINSDNWMKVKKKIRELNFLVRGLLDSHGFSPDKDDDTRGL